MAMGVRSVRPLVEQSRPKLLGSSCSPDRVRTGPGSTPGSPGTCGRGRDWDWVHGVLKSCDIPRSERVCGPGCWVGENRGRTTPLVGRGLDIALERMTAMGGGDDGPAVWTPSTIGGASAGWPGGRPVPYDPATFEKGHGRIERRECWVISDPESWNTAPAPVGLYAPRVSGKSLAPARDSQGTAV